MRLLAISCHERPVTQVKINYDGDLLFSSSVDKKICLFYAVSGERIGTFKCQAAVKAMDVSRDSKYLITMTSIGHIELWQVDGG